MQNSDLDYQRSDALEMSRNLALYYTMTAGVLAGVAEIWRHLTDPPPSWLAAVANVLDILVIVGGVVMGALFVAHLARGRKFA